MLLNLFFMNRVGNLWGKRGLSDKRIGATVLHLTTSVKESLSKVFGIGFSRSKEIVASLGMGIHFPMLLFTNYMYDIVLNLSKVNLIVERRLQDLYLQQLEFMWEIGSNQGFRLWNNLPINGQRTKTNAGTPRRMKLYSPRVSPVVKEQQDKWEKHAKEMMKRKKKK